MQIQESIIIQHHSGAFVGVALNFGSKEDDALAFRAAARELLTTHTPDEARAIFDQELQLAVFGEAK